MPLPPPCPRQKRVPGRGARGRELRKLPGPLLLTAPNHEATDPVGPGGMAEELWKKYELAIENRKCQILLEEAHNIVAESDRVSLLAVTEETKLCYVYA